MAIDKKDMKLLYELDSNSRQSLGQIGKKVRLPKNVVLYRIKRLEQAGIIKNYYAVIDASRLGYFSIRFYLKFQHTTPLIEEKIIEHFKNYSGTWWVASTEPIWDLAVITWVKDIKKFQAFWEKTLAKFGIYFQKSLYSIYFQAVHYNYDYLLDKKVIARAPEIIGGNEKIQVDATEMKILNILSANARMPLTEIANKLKITPKIANYRIKKLIKNKIIIGFRTNIDIEKIGYQNYRFNIYLSDYSQKNKIESYVTLNLNLVYINRAIGHGDLEYEFHFRSIDELRKFADEIRAKFSESIRSYDFFIFRKVHKEQFMPYD